MTVWCNTEMNAHLKQTCLPNFVLQLTWQVRLISFRSFEIWALFKLSSLHSAAVGIWVAIQGSPWPLWYPEIRGITPFLPCLLVRHHSCSFRLVVSIAAHLDQQGIKHNLGEPCSPDSLDFTKTLLPLGIKSFSLKTPRCILLAWVKE